MASGPSSLVDGAPVLARLGDVSGACAGGARLVGEMDTDHLLLWLDLLYERRAGPARNGGRAAASVSGAGSSALRPRAWLPATVDWLAAAIQFAGTVMFNISTFAAMRIALTAHQANVRMWAPNVVGSGCFLISSVLAFANSEHRWLSWRPRDLDWWIPALNLLGSLAFGVSAIASFVSPATGLAVRGDLANLGTALGALGFLIAAVLLVPQADRQLKTWPS